MTPPSRTIFRQRALDRLSSPEQLDMLVRITRPAGWVALLAILGLLVLAVLWGVYGSIPTKVTGSAILIKTGGVFDVVSRSGGLVTDLSVTVGDTVRRGQRIARIAQPDMLNELSQFRAQRAELQRKNDVANRMIQQKRSTLASQSDALRRRLVAQEQLLREGLITRQTLLATQQEIDEKAAQAKQLDLEALAGEQQLADLDRRIEGVRGRLRQSTDVISPYNGRVLEIKLDENSLVQPGTAILNMELAGDAIKDLEVVAFVSALEGKRIRPGMDLHLSPSTVRREDHGYLVAKVTAVAEFPSTQQGMMRILQNAKLVEQLAAGSAPIQVSADLIPDPQSASGYRWTSRGGPPVQLQSGTLGQASITVSEQPPLSLVIPTLRQWAGL